MRAEIIQRPQRTATPLLLVLGVLLIALNLRPAITSLPPLFPEVAHWFGLTGSAVTALAALPVFCFGVVSFFAPPLARRFGEERPIGIALILLTLTQALRMLAGPFALFLGTVFAAGALAFCNVLTISVIKRRAGRRSGAVLGWYMLCYGFCVLASTTLAVPLYHALGANLPLATGLWALPAAAAALAWIPQFRYGTRESAPAAAGIGIYRKRIAWQVTCYAGAQSVFFYAMTSFLPSMFRDRGISADGAGLLAGLVGVGGLVVSFGTPMLAEKLGDQRPMMAPIVVCCAAGILGCLYAPVSTAAVWVILIGLGAGAAQPLALYLTIARTETPAGAAALSGMSQGVGYLLAGFGPLLFGLLHTATGAWEAPVFALLAVLLVELVVGLLACRPERVPL